MSEVISKVTSAKLNKRIQDMFEFESDNFLVNINLKKEVSDKLFSYQLLHLFNLLTALRNSNVILDGSSVGVGKTYTAIALCKQLRLQPFIIAPKTILKKWVDVCDYFGVKPLTVSNYEMCTTGRILDNNNKIITSDMLGIKEDKYIWDLPKHSIIIFDEVHKARNPKSLHGVLLQSTKSNNNKVLMISATISDNPQNFAIFGYMLGFYNTLSKGRNWINSMLRDDQCQIGSSNSSINSSSSSSSIKISAINKQIYPFKGSQIKISELGDKFPKNHISAECYTLNNPKLIEQIDSSFKIIQDSCKNITLKSNCSTETLPEMTKAHKLIENAKIPIFESLIQDYLENNISVVVFVNFLSTLITLANMFNNTSVLHGGLTTMERETNIKDFQDNKTRIFICIMKTGGVGIDLHDLHGIRRVALISPNYSCIDLKQAIGRISRVGAVSNAVQRLIYVSNTCEEAICNRLNNKMAFLDKLSLDNIKDEDLQNL